MGFELIKNTPASVDERIDALLQSGDAALKRYPKPYRQRAQVAYDEALYLLLVKLRQLQTIDYHLKDRHQIREILVRQLFLRQKISSVTTFRGQSIDVQMIALHELIDALSISIPDKAVLKSAMRQYYSPRPDNTESFSIDDEGLLSYIEFISTVLSKTVPGSPERLWQLIDAAQKNPNFPSIIDLSKLTADRNFEYIKGLLNDLGRKLFNIDAEKITSSLGDPQELLMLFPEMNQKFLERLFKKALETGCEKIILLLGSIRQSAPADLAEMHKAKQKDGIDHSWFTPSSFQVLRLVETTLNHRCQQDGGAPLFVADYAVVTDLANGLESGEHAKACLAALDGYTDANPSNAGLYLHYASFAQNLQVSCPIVLQADVAQMHVEATKGAQLTIISTAESGLDQSTQLRQALVEMPESIPSTLKVSLTDSTMLTHHTKPLTQDVAFEHKAKYGVKVSAAHSQAHSHIDAVGAKSGKAMPAEATVKTGAATKSHAKKSITIVKYGKTSEAKTAVIFREKTKGHLSHKDHGKGLAK